MCRGRGRSLQKSKLCRHQGGVFSGGGDHHLQLCWLFPPPDYFLPSLSAKNEIRPMSKMWLSGFGSRGVEEGLFVLLIEIFWPNTHQNCFFRVIFVKKAITSLSKMSTVSNNIQEHTYLSLWKGYVTPIVFLVEFAFLAPRLKSQENLPTQSWRDPVIIVN